MSDLWRRFTLAFLAIVLFLFATSCSAPDGNSRADATPAPDTESSETVDSAETKADEQFADLPRLEGNATVVFTIDDRPVTIEVDGDRAPITAGNFVDLVQRGTYDGLAFHRVVREPTPFVVQGGDPQSKDPKVAPERLGTGSFIDPRTQQPRYIPLEILPEGQEEPVYSATLEEEGIQVSPELNHKRGAVAMARSPAPDSASSQFYVALSDLPALDGSYAVFGYVTDGMDVIDTIEQGDRIETAEVIEGLENLKQPGQS